ncbi:MAG: PKD domain-containing protein, partial [Bacteroidales bacterium]|nr:PKD domain-containing protein [Bacteroidales bacterium]
MKKLLLITLLALATVIVMAQQVERERVVMEIGTGTWCGYCPGAAVGADDMVENGHDVAVIENHNGDSWANTYSNGRNAYYGITGYPTAMFDGVEEVGGGIPCPNPGGMYGSYLPKYNIRKAILSSFTIDMTGSQTGLAVNVTLVINKVASAATANCVVHLFITETHIQQNWQGCMTELNFVNRLMVPGLDGTPLNLTNDEQTINLSFNLDGGWDQDHIELVALVQNNTTKETYQATMSPLDELSPAPLVADFEASETLVCQGTNVLFTDNTQGSPSSWQWTFPGGTPSSSTQESPTVVYNTPGTYDVTLYVNDGFTNDEITKTAYITSSSEAPGTPGAPEGPDQLCKNPPNSDFTTSGSANAVLYDWEIDPVNAGFIMNDGNQTVTVNFVNAFTGTASLKVKATNGCGESEFSDELVIAVAESPNAYDVNGGGAVCEGASVEVEVTNSDTGIDYELFLDDEPTGYIITGTGDPITYSD